MTWINLFLSSRTFVPPPDPLWKCSYSTIKIFATLLCTLNICLNNLWTKRNTTNSATMKLFIFHRYSFVSIFVICEIETVEITLLLNISSTTTTTTTTSSSSSSSSSAAALAFTPVGGDHNEHNVDQNKKTKTPNHHSNEDRRTMSKQKKKFRYKYRFKLHIYR